MNKYTTEFKDTTYIEEAANEAGNLNEVARRTGISRRRLGKIKAGSLPSVPERNILRLLAERKL